MCFQNNVVESTFPHEYSVNIGGWGVGVLGVFYYGRDLSLQGPFSSQILHFFLVVCSIVLSIHHISSCRNIIVLVKSHFQIFICLLRLI